MLGTIPLLAPAATWASLAGSISTEDLVAVTDRLLFGTRTSPPLLVRADLTGFLDAAPGRRGARDLRTAVRLSDRAWSRPETLLRLLLRGAGLPPFAVNEPVALSSGRIRYPDLAWPELLIAVEYDGRGHDSPDQVAADAARREEFADDGWLTVHVRARELFSTPSEIVARVVRRRAQRGAPLGRTIEMTKTPRFEP
jgi:very-short-patch-repair endonuclease